MKKLVLYIIIFFSSVSCGAQAYIPMPADSAIWRYRIYDIDYITQVLDNILFLNGQDTVAYGNTYHKIFSRTCRQTGGAGFNPPIVTTEANSSDIVYGAMREAGMQVFLLSGGGEDLAYDFNAGVGDSIPAYVGKNKVTAIDSVLISGVFHKRWLTTDSTWFVIEGIGSNRGLIPALNDGSGTVNFYCFTDTPVTWSPDTTIPCTYIYPAGYASAVTNVSNPQPELSVYPVPANDVLHIATTAGELHAVIFDCIGREVWNGDVTDGDVIPVALWPKGVYCMKINDNNTGIIVKKIVVE